MRAVPFDRIKINDDEQPLAARCFYCAGPLDGGSVEHILPAAIGAELTTSAVCECCNSRAGAEVDTPWLADPFVRPLRLVFGIPDRRGRLIQPQATKVSIGDDRDGLLTDHGDRIEIRPLPRVERTATSIRFEATLADAETIRTRIERDHPDVDWHTTTPLEPEPLTATVTTTLNPDIWSRFAAKVALGTLSLICADPWTDSHTAKVLRDVLWTGASHQVGTWDRRGVAWSAAPIVLDRRTHPGDLLNGAEHLLCFESANEQNAVLNIVAFGELLYQVPLPAALDSWGKDRPVATAKSRIGRSERRRCSRGL